MPTFEVRYPEIEVKFSEIDGNAFMLLGTMKNALRDGLRYAGYDSAFIDLEIERFMDQATAGDYDHLVQTCMKWVEVN